MKKTFTEKKIEKFELSNSLRQFLPPTDELTLGVHSYWYVHLGTEPQADRKSDALPKSKNR
jgi:hypothetical protein